MAYSREGSGDVDVRDVYPRAEANKFIMNEQEERVILVLWMMKLVTAMLVALKLFEIIPKLSLFFEVIFITGWTSVVIFAVVEVALSHARKRKRVRCYTILLVGQCVIMGGHLLFLLVLLN